MGEAIFIFLDNLIGEYDVVTKLGNIEFYDRQGSNRILKPIEELEALVDEL